MKKKKEFVFKYNLIGGMAVIDGAILDRLFEQLRELGVSSDITINGVPKCKRKRVRKPCQK